jgi:hypothetical protein
MYTVPSVIKKASRYLAGMFKLGSKSRSIGLKSFMLHSSERLTKQITYVHQ